MIDDLMDERIQAAQLMADNGQYFWPDITNALKSHGKESRTQKLELANA